MRINVDETMPDLQYLTGFGALYDGKWEDLCFSLYRDMGTFMYVVAIETESKSLWVKFAESGMPSINVPNDLDAFIQQLRLPYIIERHIWEEVLGGTKVVYSGERREGRNRAGDFGFYYPVREIYFKEGPRTIPCGEDLFANNETFAIYMIPAHFTNERRKYRHHVLEYITPWYLAHIKQFSK